MDNTEQLISEDLRSSPWETKPPGEDAAIAAITKALEERVRAAAANAPARRDAHPKAHGCVEAEFRVLDDLPPAFRIGVFAQPHNYKAWIRFSNGAEKPQDDSVGDARGMAVKLMDVDGSPSGTQDFVMINSPVLFVRNAPDYVSFVTASNPLRFFFPGLNPFKFRWHEMFAARAMTRQTVSNPLNIQYWSVTPYLFGNMPCKFSARPAGQPFPFTDRTTPNFLRDNLAKSLADSQASFDFFIQIQTTTDAMPVEDPTIEWKEAQSPLIPVARITIAAQTFSSPERLSFCENLSFTPWHGLAVHRPLGGINRVRRTVYEAISRLRHELNGAQRKEPTGFTMSDSNQT